MGSESMAVKSKGFVKSVSKLFNGKYQVVFEIEKPLDFTSEDLLNIEIKKFRKGRSLNANSYFHVMCDKLAKKIQPPISNVECKNMLMERYGTIDEDFTSCIILKTSINHLKLEGLHLRATGGRKVLEDNEMYSSYLVIKNSHEYNTKEMSDLINGTVDECKQLGIETLTPNELAQMKGYANG